jgi:hypothetical protein
LQGVQFIVGVQIITGGASFNKVQVMTGGAGYCKVQVITGVKIIIRVHRVVKYVSLKSTAKKYDTYFLPKIDVLLKMN